MAANDREEPGFRVSSNAAVIIASLVMSAGGGGSLYASHTSLSSKLDAKLDAVLAAQSSIEKEIAEITGARTDQSVREHDARIRALEEAVAALKVERGERR